MKSSLLLQMLYVHRDHKDYYRVTITILGTESPGLSLSPRLSLSCKDLKPSFSFSSTLLNVHRRGDGDGGGGRRRRGEEGTYE